jgi:hypothetical protein
MATSGGLPVLPLPVQQQEMVTPQNGMIAPASAPVVNNTNGFGDQAIATPVVMHDPGASITQPTAPQVMAAAGATNNSRVSNEPPPVMGNVTLGGTGAGGVVPPVNDAIYSAGVPLVQQPVIQNSQNGYMPGPQQVQNSDGQTNNVHFGEVNYDPFANAVSKGGNTAWK